MAISKISCVLVVTKQTKLSYSPKNNALCKIRIPIFSLKYAHTVKVNNFFSFQKKLFLYRKSKSLFQQKINQNVSTNRSALGKCIKEEWSTEPINFVCNQCAR